MLRSVRVRSTTSPALTTLVDKIVRNVAELELRLNVGAKVWCFRFMFENRNLNAMEILAAYEERRRQVDRRQSMHKAFDVRTDSLEGFFN